MKIKNTAVIIQNNIQYESFINAIDIMKEEKINVDIYIPKSEDKSGFNDMYEEIANKINDKKYNVYRDSTNKYYDILFQTYHNEMSDKIKRKYTIKYSYGLTAKADFSLSPRVNYVFDAFLCYGEDDASCFENFAKCFKIVNIKYMRQKLGGVPKIMIRKHYYIFQPMV